MVSKAPYLSHDNAQIYTKIRIDLTASTAHSIFIDFSIEHLAAA